MKRSLLLSAFIGLIWGLGFAQNTLTVPVSSSSDDAEELSDSEQNSDLNAGDIDLASSDLELVDDASWNGAGQIVGVRFNNITLPGNAVITNAYITFMVDDDNDETTELTFHVQDEANSQTFANTSHNISARPLSTQSVNWTVPAWTSDEIGTTKNSPAVTNLVASIMAKTDWKSGNAITFIITGTGEREVTTFDSDASKAAVLVIEYEDLVYDIEQVKDIPNYELVKGWDFSLDLNTYFNDQDSEISYQAFASNTDTLPTGLTLVDGVLAGIHPFVGNYEISVVATSDNKSINDAFNLNYTAPSNNYTLAIFHNNDGESDLLPDSITVNGTKVTGGSIGQFKNTLDSLRKQALTRGYNSMMVSSGDNFLAGLEYNASKADGVFYDAIALDSINYDAICLGNHDFDFGTTELAALINAFETNKAPYLSANLGFENTPELLALAQQGRILPSTVIEKGGEKIGIIGLTTPLLPTISSPGNTIVSEALVDSAQKYVDLFIADGINKIILISHLQNYNEDINFASQISGVDIIIAGGGDELLANDTDLGKPYNTAITDVYPVVTPDKDNKNVYIVTTPGNYRYLGNLLVDFNAQGDIIKVYPSDPVLVVGSSNQNLITAIEEPIANYIGDLSINVIAQVEDTLNYLRETLRGSESNGGNLFADAVLWQAQQKHAAFGVKKPIVAIQNSGGLRIESLIMPGDFTEDLTYEIAAFTNIVSVVEDIEPEKFLELIAYGVASAPTLDGRFPQISGFKVVYYQGEPDGMPGVKSIELNDGTKIVENGLVVDGAPSITLATIDFTANGGDGYPFAPLTYTTLGTTYQQAFKNFLTSADGLNGNIPAADYPYGVDASRIMYEVYKNPAVQSVFLAENFNGCDQFPTTWLRYSVASNANWECTGDTYGASGEDGDFGVGANGYGADEASEDWLITPMLTLDDRAFTLNFNSMLRYSGPALQVLYSTNYVGNGNPNLADWTVLDDATNAVDQVDSYDYVNSGDILLEGITGEVYIAFKYTTSGTGSGDGAIYRVDDVTVKTNTLLYENFNQPCQDDTFAEGWTALSLVTDGLFSCTSEGFEDNADDFAISANGYSVGEGEAWFITPLLALGAKDYAMTFASKVQYSGPMPIVVYSTDYSGIGDPNLATWTEITDGSDAITSTFALSPEIDLGFIDEDAYIAFKFTSEGAASGQSRIFLLDEVSIAEPAEIVMGGKVSIAEIQGNSEVSPLENSIVTTWGVVTATFNNEEPYKNAGFTSNLTGFFMQDPKGDDDASTSEGLYVYSDEDVVVGDSIELTGLVAEVYGITELKDIADLTNYGNVPVDIVLSLVEITLPLADGKSLEQFESMWVKITNELTVTENRALHTYGQLRLSASGLLETVTQVVSPDNTEQVEAHMAANTANTIILDDGSSESYPNPIPFLDDNTTMVAGTKVNELEGIMAYDFSEYRIHPTKAPQFTYASRETLPSIENATFKVATFNVLNYFNGNGDGTGFPTSRGATTVAEFTKQTQKIVAALQAIDADVVGLIEIENDADDNVSAIKMLVDSLNAAIGSNAYSFVATGEIAAYSDGYADEIKVGYIYKPSTVELIGDYAILNNAFSNQYNDQYNRPALAQTFKERATNGVFTAVVNHLKSKGSGCDDLGDPNLSDQQGNCNGTRAKAAATLVEWLATDPTGSNDADFLILGDLNSYAKEDPIDTLIQLNYTNLVEGNFSYVYDGQYGTLDYALANASLNAQIAGTEIWHINSLEPTMLSYSGVEELFQKDAYRSSDHDPVIVGLNLLSTGLNETTIANNSFDVYPNPFQNSISIELNMELKKDVSVKVLNTIGVEVAKKHYVLNNGSNKLILNLEALPSGVYLIVIDGLNTTKVLIKTE